MIIGTLLVRNESGRYLERVLEQMRQICDRIVVVDDASTDDTAAVCRKYADHVHSTRQSYFESNELALRKMQWNLSARRDGDWILCLDADETLSHPEKLRDMIAAADRHGADALGFRLFDMWNETQYRDDEHWTAHNRFWPVCVRYDALRTYRWNRMPIHCGRFPINAAERIIDAKIDILHWGWSRETDRKMKYERYKRIDVRGYGNAAQYESILDPAPKLRLYGAKRVLIGGPVRQDAATFQLYLDSLSRLDTTGIEAYYAFILHNSRELEPLIRNTLPDATVEHLADEGEYTRAETHVWEPHNFGAVIRMRNTMLQVGAYYDFLFMVDSDLLLHPQTLRQLVAADKPIVSEVFWTRWSPTGREMPNSWMADQYHFDDVNRLDEWRKPGLYRVGMTGACTLIRHDVIKAGVNYSPIANVSWTHWEDRAFCIRAAVHGFEIWMDTHYPAKHLYRQNDLQEVMEREVSGAK